MVREYCHLLFKRSIKSLLALVIVLRADHCSGQKTNQQYREINQLFSACNSKRHPGVVVGMMKYDQIIYLEAYGLASLEYDVPSTKETLFNIGSISKQFTALDL